MAKPYSDDLRERAVAAIESAHTREEVAELYNLALSTVGGFIRRKRETGSVSPAKFGGHRTFVLAPHPDLVKKLVAEQPDSTHHKPQLRHRCPLPSGHRTRCRWLVRTNVFLAIGKQAFDEAERRRRAHAER